MITLKSMSIFSFFVVFTITLNLFGTISVLGQFRGQLGDISAPDCIQSNGRRGKCYRHEECGQFYRNKVSFDICELSLQYLTVCCDELPSSRYNLFRADNSWFGDAPFSTDFECGIRIANRDILDVINAPADPNDQGQLLVQALTYLAARDGTHPWMAALWFKNKPICGATIISRRSVLTSAHCFKYSREPVDYTITVGSIYLNQGRRLQISRLVIHPDYRPPPVYNDIAIVILDSPLRFDWRVNPVCLSNSYIGDSMMKSQKATVIGFGNRSNPNRILQEITVPLISPNECGPIYARFRKYFPFGPTDEFICAGYPQGGKEACSSDSGGSMTIKHYSKTMQIGIVTYGYKCGITGFAGIYTSVGYHYHWIKENSVR